jgi:hypothetical protein
VRRLQKGLILAAGLAVIFCLAVSLRSRRDLLDARRELLAVTAANDFLKKTLGGMTVAMTAKDRQIDRLEHAGCGGQEPEKGPPAAPMPPNRSKVSD